MFECFARAKESLSPSPIPSWIQVAKREIGVKEVPGSGDNPRIIEYHAATSLKSTEDSVAWCSSFMNWVMRECHMERSGSAAARSWLGYGTHLKGFKQYSIVVFRRGNSSWQGHVAFAIDDLGKTIRVLGANQSDQICYAVYSKADVLGYRWPRAEVEVNHV